MGIIIIIYLISSAFSCVLIFGLFACMLHRIEWNGAAVFHHSLLKLCQIFCFVSGKLLFSFKKVMTCSLVFNSFNDSHLCMLHGTL